MPIEIRMPALSPTMTEGNLAKWRKREGDRISAGDVIAEIETDKATMEVEAVDDGVLGRILVAEGSESVQVNAVIGVLLQNGEAAPPVAGPDRDESPAKAKLQAEAPLRQTVREALRDAMAEEMRADPDVFLMGEEVARYQGAYKVSQGLARRVRRSARDRHADHRARLHRSRGRRRVRRPEARRRVHDLQFRHAGDGPSDQLRRQDQLHVGRTDGLPDRVPRPQRRGRPGGGPAFAMLCELVRSRSRPPRDRSLFRGRREGAAQVRDPGSEPGDIPRERASLRPDLRHAGRSGRLVPIGEAKVLRTGSDVTIAAFSIMVGHALEAADELAAKGIEAEVIDLRTLRPLDVATVVESVEKDQPHRLRGGGLASGRHRRRNRGVDDGTCLRLAGRAGCPGLRGRRASPLRGQSGETRLAPARGRGQDGACRLLRRRAMTIKILMPALSPTMTEGNLAKWHVGEGDRVSPGDVIAEIETDKASMEVEAVDEGTVGRLLVAEGTENVPVNAAIGLLLEEGEDAAALESAAAEAPGAKDDAAEIRPARRRPRPKDRLRPPRRREACVQALWRAGWRRRPDWTCPESRDRDPAAAS